MRITAQVVPAPIGFCLLPSSTLAFSGLSHTLAGNCKICREEAPNSSGQWNASQVSMKEWRNARKGNSSISIYFLSISGPFFLGSKITADGDCSHEMKKTLASWKKSYENLDSILKNRHHFANKGPYSQSYGFSTSYIRM